MLKQHGYDLSKFCDELDRESFVLDIFGAGVRPDTITTLVAEVPGPTEQKTADTAEHLNEVQDILTKLRKGTRILSLRMFCSTASSLLVSQASEKCGNWDPAARRLEVAN